MPPLESEMLLMAKVKVVGLRMEKDNSTMEIQIIAMDLSKPKKEKSAEETLYGEEKKEG
jgi:hypothetical protein